MLGLSWKEFEEEPYDIYLMNMMIKAIEDQKREKDLSKITN
jgi:hypothetical protein